MATINGKPVHPIWPWIVIVAIIVGAVAYTESIRPLPPEIVDAKVKLSVEPELPRDAWQEILEHATVICVARNEPNRHMCITRDGEAFGLRESVDPPHPTRKKRY